MLVLVCSNLLSSVGVWLMQPQELGMGTKSLGICVDLGTFLSVDHETARGFKSVKNRNALSIFLRAFCPGKFDIAALPQAFSIFRIKVLCQCLLYLIATFLKRIGIFSQPLGVGSTLFQQLLSRTEREDVSCFAIARCGITVQYYGIRCRNKTKFFSFHRAN